MTGTTTREQLAAHVATHIGAITDDTGAMTCPKCGGDFGPTMTIESLAVYENGFLPGYPLLMGVCLDCGHHTEPPTDFGVDDTDLTARP